MVAVDVNMLVTIFTLLLRFSCFGLLMLSFSKSVLFADRIGCLMWFLGLWRCPLHSLEALSLIISLDKVSKTLSWLFYNLVNWRLIRIN